MGTRKSQGFTLIELLVVIGIIAVLAAIVIPVYTRAQEKGRQAVCLSNMHSIAVAIKMYAMDYRAYPPRYNVLTGEGGIAHLYQTDYLESVKVLRCPNDQLATFAGYDLLYGSLVAPEGDPARTAWRNDWEVSGFFVSHYSSYNADSTIDPDADDNGALDPGITYGPDTYDITFILYNYNGYDGTGHEKAGATDPPDPDPGHQGVKYPRLRNRWAPGSTIITHCPHHRQYFGGYDALAAQDVVVRVGGDAELTQVGTWTDNWVNQPLE